MTTQTGNRCEKGHNMDPGWDTCRYCEAEKNAGTRPESTAPSTAGDRRTHVAAGAGANHANPDRAEGRATRVSPDNFAADGNREPLFIPPNSGAGDTRRIVGVLITYTWQPWGQLFPVRLGKNFLGAGDNCDFQIKADSKISSTHALILCREGRSSNEIHFDLIDQQSSNGTYLNGELVPLTGATLPNHAKIETGKTEWLFIKILS